MFALLQLATTSQSRKPNDMSRHIIQFVFLVIAPCASLHAAELRFAKLFTDHCVLQREMSVPVWGWTTPDSQVTIEFAGQKKTATAGRKGKWLARLGPMKASRNSRELTASSAGQSVTLKDVLVGEVWLCSGQSNMGLAISKAKGGKEAVADADLPHFRMFRVKQNPMYEPGADVDGDWFLCSPKAFEDGRDFSAVGFFFGRQLLESQDCPIGLIGSYVGGSPVEAWMSEEALAAFPAGRGGRTETWKRLYAFQQARGGMDQAMAEHAPKLAAWEEELAARNQAHRKALTVWSEAVAKARRLKQEPPPRPQPGPVSRRPLEPNRYPHHATVLFRGMIEPLIPYGMRGTIWYQGEANCYPRRAVEYSTSFPLMIADWRERWGQGEFPFLFVQLPNLAKARDDWMTLRESQRLAAGSVPNTAMAVTIDIGDPNDLHPVDKKPVADRLALLARRIAYREELVAAGPIIHNAKRANDGSVRLTFRHTGAGLMTGRMLPAPFDGKATAITNRDSGYRAKEVSAKPVGFELAGRDGVFHAASAVIDNHEVLLRPATKDIEPHVVRYAWAPNPQPAANLYNREGLPASPFIINVSSQP